MSTQIIPTVNYAEIVAQLPPDSALVFRDIGWEEYEELLEAVGEAKGLHISFDQGTLHIMTLGPEHENYSRLIEKMVGILSLQLHIKVISFGSATMKKERQRRGLEPDGWFYVQTAAAIGNKINLDFNSDPPPDIAVEVDVRHESSYKLPIYAAFGVPEIWRYDGQALVIYFLQHGQYVEIEASRALPILTSRALTEFLARTQHEDQYEILLAFEKWLKAQPEGFDLSS